jgi:hypothetical protein
MKALVISALGTFIFGLIQALNEWHKSYQFMTNNLAANQTKDTVTESSIAIPMISIVNQS